MRLLVNYLYYCPSYYHKVVYLASSSSRTRLAGYSYRIKGRHRRKKWTARERVEVNGELRGKRRTG